jgi:hypothetical protein
MGTQTYAIRRRGTLEWFAGFDANCQPRFAEQAHASQFRDLVTARAQATLLNADDNAVQLKPEVLS